MNNIIFILYILREMNNKKNLKNIRGKYAINGEGSVVIITGASSGLGKQISLLMCLKNVRLIIAGRDAKRLKQVKQQCQRRSSSQVGIFQGDITNQQACKQLIEEAVKLYNRIDYLVLSAGINAHFQFSTLTNTHVFHQLMKINFYANVYIMKYALSQIKRSKATVVVISSLSGKFGLPTRTAYCSSKFALNGFFQSLRTQQDIDLLMVYPTSLETPMRQNSLLKINNKTQSNEKRQDPKKCAELIMQGIQNKKQSIYMPWKGWLGTVLQPLFPNLIRQKLKKASKL